MNKKIKISVAIPSYNSSKYILDALKYILNDSRVDEIIINDDCSDDFNLLTKKLLSLSSKIHLTRNTENLGAFANKHKTVSLCKNKWVILLDSDNNLSSNYIDTIYNLSEWKPDTIYCPNFARPNFNYKSFSNMQIDFDICSSILKKEIFTKEKMFSILLNTGNYLVYKDAYLICGRKHLNGVYAADVFCLNYLWLVSGNYLFIVSELEYDHRIGHESNYVKTSNIALAVEEDLKASIIKGSKSGLKSKLELMKLVENIKLHLGCGETYLKDYINVDFPKNRHTVQTTSKADLYYDITLLSYPSESISEIRLHHVFEHFSRPIACALLASWHSWLKKGSILHIEVPDFARTAKVVLNPFSNKKNKSKAIRHIFGSQEADWAVHYGAYTQKNLKELLKNFGFQIIQIKKNDYKGTYNFDIIAIKDSKTISKKRFEKITTNFLNFFLIDESETEKKMLSVWMKIYDKKIKKSFAK